MKFSKELVTSFLLLIVIASLYRIMPGRQPGFAPQIAMALFGGAVIKNKKFAFLLPILSMFLSDALYEVLYLNGVGNISGFYEGQFTNYLLFGLMTVFGFMITNLDLKKIVMGSIAAPTLYFLLSNSLVWASDSPFAGYGRPKTFGGWILTLQDGIPFYLWSIVATLLFSGVLFGSYFLIRKRALARARQGA
ncbi:MAG: hypothetical protein KGM98_10110 [Bacteroidota bacterium]|nr:hypothetical protein [Bacteroidota bacterium]